MSVDSRRQALLQSALTAMVRAQWGDDVAATAEERPALLGAGLVGTVGGEMTAWTLDAGAPRLGAALRFAHRYGATRLHMCSGSAHGGVRTAARQAGQFRLKTRVWCRHESGLQESVPTASVEPTPPSDEVLAMGSVLEAAGADAVIEDGVLRGEVLGLEVARVVTPEWCAAPVLQVGVGHHDREARAMVDPDASPTASLADVVATVRALRQPDAPSHPANLLAPERWLRAVVMARPELAGATHLRPRPSPVARTDLRSRAPAPAAGTDVDGDPVVIVCSVGVDPELIPASADARLTEAVAQGLDPGKVKLVVVVPEGDDYPVTRDLAALLYHPASVITVGRDWRRQ